MIGVLVFNENSVRGANIVSGVVNAVFNVAPYADAGKVIIVIAFRLVHPNSSLVFPAIMIPALILFPRRESVCVRRDEALPALFSFDGRERMSLYAIGDLHLSLGTDKPMDVFGRDWENYVEKLIEGFKDLSENDVCVICGDVSWGMNLKEAAEDFLFISRLPGQKIVLKGNHDYWWSTASKVYGFFEEKGIDNIKILHNNCFFMRNLPSAEPGAGFTRRKKAPSMIKKSCSGSWDALRPR